MAKKKETTEIAVSNPQLTKSLAILESLKAEIDTQANNCLQIKVVDESTLAVCQQNLSKINQLVKTVDEKRIEIKAPYLEASKSIDSTAKSLTEMAVKAVEHLKNEVKEWEKARIERERKAQEELDRKFLEETAAREAEANRKAAINDYIQNKALVTLKSLYESCVDVDSCVKAQQVIEENYKPREFFQEYADLAYQYRDNYLTMIRTKQVAFAHTGMMSEEELKLRAEKEAIANQKMELAAKEAELAAKEAEIEAGRLRKAEEERLQQEAEKLKMEADSDKTRGVRHTWKTELVDKSKLIQDWIAVDEAAVKEYLKANKETIKDGEIINGVKFYKEISITA